MKNFKNKKAVITGAGSGIGQALAMQLAKKGAILILSDINADTLADTEKLVKALGAECYCYTVDVSEEDAIQKFASEVLQQHQYIDMLFNNAGFALGKISLKEVKMDDFHKIVNVNMWGVINHTKVFLDSLLSRPEAAIINISSLFGLIGVPDQVPYCTTKFAVRGFTEALRGELYNTKVQVHTVHPGGINTNIYKNAVHYKQDAKVDRKFQKMLERTTPEEAAKTILRGVEHKTLRILIGADAELLDKLARTLPEGYTSFIQRGLKKIGF